MAANTGFAQAPDTTPTTEPSSLPLPQHPGRVAPNSEFSRPKAAQPNRESHAPSPTAASSIRRGGKTPMPGRPARGLLPPGEQEGDASEESGDEAADEAVDPGLLRFLPHELYDGGLIIEYIYTGETFNKARGGLNRNRPTNYRSNLDLVATLDTELMNWWSGGRLFVYGQNLVGQPLSPSDVGDIQLFSNLDSTANGDFQGRQETAIEVFYKYRFSPYFTVQPDLQFISQPGGIYDDALLAGLRFELVL
ncbi:MAG: carbohydrate porin [Pirellulaceae bacterium]|nr:carbohydrate porin [Pirellulaceae bacterium]